MHVFVMCERERDSVVCACVCVHARMCWGGGGICACNHVCRYAHLCVHVWVCE